MPWWLTPTHPVTQEAAKAQRAALESAKAALEGSVAALGQEIAAAKQSVGDLEAETADVEDKAKAVNLNSREQVRACARWSVDGGWAWATWWWFLVCGLLIESLWVSLFTAAHDRRPACCTR